MDEGSIQEVAERLTSWGIEYDRGFARVEWDSMDAQREVVAKLRSSLPPNLPLLEIELAAGGKSQEIAAGLINQLGAAGNCVASISGIEWAFPKNGKVLDTLIAFNFQRETLASLPVRQIWWIPTGFAGMFILGIPDLESWFQLRLHLTERSSTAKVGIYFGESNRKNVSVDEARSLARKFWNRLETAQKQGFPEERIWLELAEPAVDALMAAGLELQAV